MELKEWTPYGELVSLLEARGIIVTDRMSVIRFLNQVNYYKLIGYLVPLGLRGRSFHQTIPFETLKKIYEFDASLANLVSGAVGVIEHYVAEQLCHYHGKHYGPEGYMNPSSFNAFHKDDVFKRKISNCISSHRSDEVIRHHLDVYEGHFPIWVIIEFFTMGMLSYFYCDMFNRDKRIIAFSMYGVDYRIMESWMRCITDLRNICAHYDRLYGHTFVAFPRMPKQDIFVPDRKLFTQLMMLRLMYPDRGNWNRDFVVPLEHLIEEYREYINLDHIGFPNLWLEKIAY